MNDRYGCYNRTDKPTHPGANMNCGYLENATDRKCKGCRWLNVPLRDKFEYTETVMDQIDEHRERLCNELIKMGLNPDDYKLQETIRYEGSLFESVFAMVPK